VQKHEEADAAAETDRQDWVNAMANAISTPEEIATAKAQYDFQLEQVRAFESVEAGVLAFASYLRFYNRLRAATQYLIALGVLALFGLMGFSFAVQASKDEKGPAVVVVPIVSPPPAPASAPPEPAKERALIGTVLFETGSATLSAQAREAIEHARNELLAKPDTALLLIARTDTVGGSSVNHTLARDRAGSIRELLVGVGGVAAVRVFAAEVPKSDLPKLTEDHRENAENRSVSMYLIPFRR